jgi:hypothetical protein
MVMNTSSVRRGLAALIGAFAVGAVASSADVAGAEDSSLPSGEFWANVTYCPGSVSFSECTAPTVDGGYWAFHTDASLTRWSDGVEQPGHGAWDETAPGELFVEFYNDEDQWLFSVDADQVSGGDYPCYEGLVDDLDIGVVSVRLCLEP